MRIRIKHDNREDEQMNVRMSKWKIIFYMPAAAAILFLSMTPAQAQENNNRTPKDSTAEKKGFGIRDIILHKFSDDDVSILITSIEWGVPDRWSFTSRYVHMFTQNRDTQSLINNFTATISPGIDALRISAGYQAILTKRFWIGVDLLNELRFTWMHTWNKPIIALKNENYGGIELRSSFTGLLNMGFGYFLPLSSSSKSGSLICIHAGVGI
jgi:hypothetical protein